VDPENDTGLWIVFPAPVTLPVVSSNSRSSGSICATIGEAMTATSEFSAVRQALARSFPFPAESGPITYKFV
jgi:hypothetical protein